MRTILMPLFLTLALTACDQKSDDTGSPLSADESPTESDTEPDSDDSGDADEGAPIPDAGSVDDACGTSDAGYGSPSDDALEALERTNCYRNIMQIDPGTLDRDLDQASQSHADYMNRHDTLTHWQDSSRGGFTGEWVWDRMEAAGFDTVAGQAWSEVVAWGNTPAEAVDMWMGSVYHRIPLTMPYWIAAGFGQTQSYSAMSFVSPYPDGPRAGVVFPVNGQTDVTRDFDSDTEWPDPAPNHGVVGYPISVTVAAESVGSDYANPYDTELISASLYSADGQSLDFISLDPSNDEDMGTMVAIVPVEPFRSGTQYTATLTVLWDGSEETFQTTFTTE